MEQLESVERDPKGGSMGTTLTMVGIAVVVFAVAKALRGAGSAPVEEVRRLVREEGAPLIDVRTATEFGAGHIEGAVNISHDQIEAQAAKIKAGKEDPIVLYCRSGARATVALQTLKRLGYTNVLNAGSIAALNGRL
jgi:phage shock protein E